MNIIETLERDEIAKLTATRQIPDFQPGDTLQVNVKVVEGERSRVQAYEGVCIGRSGSGINENFTVRKISYGEGVERVFPVYSPMIESVKVIRRGKVRRAKLYYLRDRRGKSARIVERAESAEAKAARIEAKAAKKSAKAAESEAAQDGRSFRASCRAVAAALRARFRVSAPASRGVTRVTGATTSWAMRRPRAISKARSPRLTSSTETSPR